MSLRAYFPDEDVLVPILTPHVANPAVTGPSSFWIIGGALLAGWAIFRAAKPDRKKTAPQQRPKSRQRKRK